MRSAMRAAHNVRLAAILALGAFALHQLRYAIASSAEPGGNGHGYLTDLMPPLAVLVVAAVLATVIRGTEAASMERAPLGRRIAVFALALLAIYAAQESLEGMLAAGHPGGLAALLADDGWIALPLALVIGASAALLARAFESIERVIAVVHTERSARPRAPAVRGRGFRARGVRLTSAPLAFGLARRPPPLTPA